MAAMDTLEAFGLIMEVHEIWIHECQMYLKPEGPQLPIRIDLRANSQMRWVSTALPSGWSRAISTNPRNRPKACDIAILIHNKRLQDSMEECARHNWL